MLGIHVSVAMLKRWTEPPFCDGNYNYELIELHHLGKDLQAYTKNFIPYAFKFMREQYEAVPKVKVLSQQISREFTLSGWRKTNQELHLATISHCDCSFFTCMSLPCKHIFKVCEVVNLPAWIPRKYETLGHKGWKMDFYTTTNRLSPEIPILHDHVVEHCVEYVSTLAENKTTLTQSQKFIHVFLWCCWLSALSQWINACHIKRNNASMVSLCALTPRLYDLPFIRDVTVPGP